MLEIFFSHAGFWILCTVPAYLYGSDSDLVPSVVNSYFFHGDDDAADDGGSVVFPSRKCAQFG